MGGLREFIYLNGDKFVLTFFWLRSYIIVGMVSYCEPINYILVMVGGAEYTFFLLPRFDTVEAAEKCINALRHYRNLHPSFSKVRSNLICRLPRSKVDVPYHLANAQDPRDTLRPTA